MRRLVLVLVGALLGGCSGASSASSEPSIAGTWGASGPSYVDDYLVVGPDKTFRVLHRVAIQGGASVTTCASGTYFFANGVLSTTVQYKTANGEATLSSSARIELVDDSMRLTSDADAGTSIHMPGITIYNRRTLPDGLEASCPK